MADRKSLSGFPELLKAAELAVCSTRAVSRGSAPTTVTTRSEVVLGSANAWLIRMTTSGKQGRSMVPSDTSVAKRCRNARAIARSSGVAAGSPAGTDWPSERYVGTFTLGIGESLSQYRFTVGASGA